MSNPEEARVAAEAAGRSMVLKRAKIILKGINVLDDNAIATVAQDPELWSLIRRQMGVDPERVVGEIVKSAHDELVAEKAAKREVFDEELRAARKRTTE